MRLQYYDRIHIFTGGQPADRNTGVRRDFYWPFDFCLVRSNFIKLYQVKFVCSRQFTYGQLLLLDP